MIEAHFRVPAANRAIVEDVVARTYRLVVEGEFDDEVEIDFEGFTLTSAAGTTTLTGFVRDQAELHGFLQRMSSLDLTVIEVTAVDEAGQPIAPEEQVLR